MFMQGLRKVYTRFAHGFLAWFTQGLRMVYARLLEVYARFTQGYAEFAHCLRNVYAVFAQN